MPDSDIGNRVSAGMILTKCLREIAAEKTEVGGLDSAGKNRMITKTEALARVMFKLALGYEEEIDSFDKKTNKLKRIKKIFRPDSTMIAMVYDRLEGKVATDTDNTKKKQPLSSKVSEAAKQRVNKLAEE